MKIIKFKNHSDNIIEFLENVIRAVKEDNLDNVMICYKNKKNKEMCTGYYNLDMGQKMECVGHIQADIIDEMIRENIDRYIDVVEV